MPFIQTVMFISALSHMSRNPLDVLLLCLCNIDFCRFFTTVASHNLADVCIVFCVRCKRQSSHQKWPRRGVEVQLYSFFSISARWLLVVNAIPWSVYTQERDPLPIVQEYGCAPGPIWMGADNLTLTQILCSECSSPSQLLYPLCYPGPLHETVRSI